jgi:Spy/CpxP family protein refolding chaperone
MKKILAVLAMAGMFMISVGAFAQQPPTPPQKPEKPVPGAPQERMKNWLDLTPEQETKLKDFQKARQEEQKAFRDQMGKLQGELTPLLKDAKADQNKVNGLIDQMFKLRADQFKKSLKNGNDREKIFTPEQLEKMKNARGGMNRMMMLRGRGMGPMGPMGQGRFMRPGMGPFGFGRQGMGSMQGPWGMHNRMMRRPGAWRGLWR